jgi:hypothetical protein
MNYDSIIIDVALRERFGYDIPKVKVKLKRRQNFKKAKAFGPSKPTVFGASHAKKASKKKEWAKRKVPPTNKTPPGSPEAIPRPSTSSPLSSGLSL